MDPLRGIKIYRSIVLAHALCALPNSDSLVDFAALSIQKDEDPMLYYAQVLKAYNTTKLNGLSFSDRQATTQLLLDLNENFEKGEKPCFISVNSSSLPNPSPSSSAKPRFLISLRVSQRPACGRAR